MWAPVGLYLSPNSHMRWRQKEKKVSRLGPMVTHIRATLHTPRNISLRQTPRSELCYIRTSYIFFSIHITSNDLILDFKRAGDILHSRRRGHFLWNSKRLILFYQCEAASHPRLRPFLIPWEGLCLRTSVFSGYQNLFSHKCQRDIQQ